jgi:hypothetical protein
MAEANNVAAAMLIAPVAGIAAAVGRWVANARRHPEGGNAA